MFDHVHCFCELGKERATINKMNDISGVSEAIRIAGVYDIVAKVSALSREHVSKVVKKIRAIADQIEPDHDCNRKCCKAAKDSLTWSCLAFISLDEFQILFYLSRQRLHRALRQSCLQSLADRPN